MNLIKKAFPTAIVMIAAMMNGNTPAYGAEPMMTSVPDTLNLSSPIVFGNNRLSIITPTLFRLESTTDGKFVDARTMFAYDRTSMLPDSLLTIERISPSQLTPGATISPAIDAPTYRITTPAIRIEYVDDGHPFSTANLQAYYKFNGKERKFTIRQIQRGNLGGPIETVDRLENEVPLSDGLLSTDGWHMIDDNRADLLDENGWITPRPSMPAHIHDYYCFVYGSDFKAALQSLGAISGRTPMTRKWVHGIWYSKYQDYTSEQLLGVIDEYRQHDYPLDNVVLDMGWHTNIWDNGTSHNSRRNWTGYTWNTSLIPNPKALIDTIHAMGLTLTLNDHPHDGLRPGEKHYPAFARQLGYDPQGKAIPQFDLSSKQYVDAFFNHALAPTDSIGLDLWWIDWQQNYIYPYVAGTNTRTLPWLNELYYRNSAKNGKRGATYSRWGGWGDHRHPLNFSGDAHSNWEMLAFEIKLTLASGNAGCFFWAHDIGGHKGTVKPELLARWVQFGAMSAALRIHSSRTPEFDRRPWFSKDSLSERSMHRAYKLRAELMPYVYTSVRQTHDQMIPLTRPMYIDYISQKPSLKYGRQYMFGDLLLTAPIDKAGEGLQYIASQTVWFPDGEEWYDFFTHEHHQGGNVEEIAKSLETFPLFVKAGWVLPMQPFTYRPASTVPQTLVLRIYPTETECDNTYRLYEDDGISMEYTTGKYATTPLRYQHAGEWHTVSILPMEGTYKGAPDKRSFILEIGASEPVDPTINGRKAKASFDAEKGVYTISVPATAVRKGTTLKWRR